MNSASTITINVRCSVKIISAVELKVEVSGFLISNDPIKIVNKANNKELSITTAGTTVFPDKINNWWQINWISKPTTYTCDIMSGQEGVVAATTKYDRLVRIACITASVGGSCLKDSCKNGGVCLGKDSGTSKFKCSCPVGYSGDTC
eukprot:UN24754